MRYAFDDALQECKCEADINNALLNCLRELNPVSYTHLDVYKRQDIYIPVRQREDARRASEERGRILWEQEMKRRKEL